jgi:hypothetical protein
VYPAYRAAIDSAAVTLDEILATFLNSSQADWSDDLSTPTFLYGSPADEDDKRAHHGRKVYKPDIAIGLAWGSTVNDSYHDPWLNKYPDKSPGRSFFIDLLYNGQVVYRELGVSVDGGRYTLPAGRGVMSDDQREVIGWYAIPEEHEFLSAFARATGHTREFESGFQISGMTIGEPDAA